MMSDGHHAESFAAPGLAVVVRSLDRRTAAVGRKMQVVDQNKSILRRAVFHDFRYSIAADLVSVLSFFQKKLQGVHPLYATKAEINYERVISAYIGLAFVFDPRYNLVDEIVYTGSRHC